MKLLNVTEAAKITGVSRFVIYGRLNRGRLRFKKCDCCGYVGIDRDELLAWRPCKSNGGETNHD
jgi:predicted DNA-binding transcriptional regulator AlpA